MKIGDLVDLILVLIGVGIIAAGITLAPLWFKLIAMGCLELIALELFLEKEKKGERNE